MIRKWRFEASNVACYNYWCNFELTVERFQTLIDLNARVYPLSKVIMFECEEDIMMFTLKSGLHDFR